MFLTVFIILAYPFLQGREHTDWGMCLLTEKTSSKTLSTEGKVVSDTDVSVVEVVVGSVVVELRSFDEKMTSSTSKSSPEPPIHRPIIL